MRTVTLITDWGLDGIYVGAFKGKLLSQANELQLVDISHQITPYDTGQAAFTLRSCYNLFPKSTIHVMGVGGEISRKEPKNRVYICFEKDGYFFIGNDDGSWRLVFDELPEKIYKLKSDDAMETYSGFPELGIFSETILKLCNNILPEKIGEKYSLTHTLLPSRAALHPSIINGEIIYIDFFGNAITNISKTEFERVGKNRKFDIFIGSYNEKYKISKINKEYSETVSSNLMAIFSYSGLLEIAIANGQASSMFNIKQNKEVRVKFYD